MKNFVAKMIASIGKLLVDTNNYPQGNTSFELFMQEAREMVRPRILELGTKRALPSLSTRHDSWFPNAGEYIGADIQKDEDVDLIADIHRLTAVTGEEQFDIILTDAGFEHFKYPHLAALEIMKALKIGGLLFIQTHHTFPLHACPFDYFRFSKEALSGLFGTKMGFRVIAAEYASPAVILSHIGPENYKYPAYLHIRLFGKKTESTPKEYVYEYDC